MERLTFEGNFCDIAPWRMGSGIMSIAIMEVFARMLV